MRYTATCNYTMNLRAEHNTASAIVGSLPYKRTAGGDTLWTATETTAQAHAGDKWLLVNEIDGKPINALIWLAIVHLGRAYCTLEDSNARQYYRLRWDWEPGSGWTNPRTFRPAIINLQQLQHNWLDKRWQEFWFNLNITGDSQRDVKAWNNYANSKAFITDGTGIDNFRNYITGRNMDKPLPKIESKVCAGNVVCVIGQPVTIMHRLHYQIETLDITSAPPEVSYHTHPHLIHHTTTYAGIGVCNPFPHLGGRDTGVPVYFPVTSRGAVYYPVEFLQKLPIGARIPNPYSPPME